MKKVLSTLLWITFSIFLLFWFFVFSTLFEYKDYAAAAEGSSFESPNYTAGIIAVLVVLIPVLLIRSKRKKKAQQAAADPERRRAEERSRVHMMDNELALIDQGVLPNVFGTGIVLKNGEKAYFNASAELITSKERVVGHTGRSGGVSVRVTRGVTLHSGSSSGRPVYGRVEQTYKGSIIITSDRIVFVNPLKGFEVKTDKITAISPYSDGIGIQAGNKSYTLIVPYSDYAIKVLNLMRLY